LQIRDARGVRAATALAPVRVRQCARAETKHYALAGAEVVVPQLKLVQLRR
jgi:hypothetical protein